ncbi:MAG: S8 family serine peptidase [Deltaproteobacteria bacterium]|nr:S8 family serine peptidase [Deltaproteobacteria bacterium]
MSDEVEFAGSAGMLAGLIALRGDGRTTVEPLFPPEEIALSHWYRITPSPAGLGIPFVRGGGTAPQVWPARGPRDEAAGRIDATDDRPTPSWLSGQRYLAPAPDGIDAIAGWARPGGAGQAVRLAVVEHRSVSAHEDLPADRIAIERRGSGSPAALGVLIATDDGRGVTGIVPAVPWTIVVGEDRGSLAQAIERAAHDLRAGDVLLIDVEGELASDRAEGARLPVEYWPSSFAVIQAATARGVIVVEAAGDDGIDLDDPRYGRAFDRRVRDSGAILVGAGAPAGPAARSRLGFSNHGARVDLQGWGAQVTTIGGGDLQRTRDWDSRARDYTAVAGGTGTAAAIVAGAAAQIASVYRAAHGEAIAPAQLRALLVATGTPQVDAPGAPLSEHIGPLPNVQAALAAIDRR